MNNPLRTGPSSTRVRGWLEHDKGRTPLSHAAADSVIGRGDIPAFESGELVTTVGDHETRRAVRVATATPAGSRCLIEDAAGGTTAASHPVSAEAAA